MKINVSKFRILFFLIFVDYTDLDSLLIFSAVLICCLESGLRIYNVEPLRELRRIGKRSPKPFDPSQIELEFRPPIQCTVHSQAQGSDLQVNADYISEAEIHV